MSASAVLLGRISSGEQSAEEELARTYGRRIRAIAVARTRDPEVARDLAQDILVAVIKAARAAQIRDPDKLEAFIQGTSKNVINNYFRTNKRLSETGLDAIDQPIWDAVPSYEAAERRRLVQQELKRCSVQDQQILLLSLVDGHSLAEVAKRLDISHDTARARKSRLIKKLTEIFGSASQKESLKPL